jgi:hypothetical protein
MKKTITYIFLFFLFSSNLSAQTTVKIDLMKNSWLAINGTTNIISFKLVHEGEKLLGSGLTISVTQQQDKLFLSENKLSIDVINFKSDNKMALRDFLKLIKSDSYPTLDVHLNYIETTPGIEKEKYSKGNAVLDITITGITNQYNFPVISSRHGEFITVDGSKKINIRDFGLEPPTEMFGLIKVSEWITINFHMVCKLTFAKENKKTLTRNY